MKYVSLTIITRSWAKIRTSNTVHAREMHVAQNVKESDWKLFRKRLPQWQEAFMERLLADYSQIIESDQSAAERFWALFERIRNDRQSAGVVAEMRRSVMRNNLLGLLLDGVIGFDDLEGFSDELRDSLEVSYKVYSEY